MDVGSFFILNVVSTFRLGATYASDARRTTRTRLSTFVHLSRRLYSLLLFAVSLDPVF